MAHSRDITVLSAVMPPQQFKARDDCESGPALMLTFHLYEKGSTGHYNSVEIPKGMDTEEVYATFCEWYAGIHARLPTGKQKALPLIVPAESVDSRALETLKKCNRFAEAKISPVWANKVVGGAMFTSFADFLNLLKRKSAILMNSEKGVYKRSSLRMISRTNVSNASLDDSDAGERMLAQLNYNNMKTNAEGQKVAFPTEDEMANYPVVQLSDGTTFPSYRAQDGSIRLALAIEDVFAAACECQATSSVEAFVADMLRTFHICNDDVLAEIIVRACLRARKPKSGSRGKGSLPSKSSLAPSSRGKVARLQPSSSVTSPRGKIARTQSSSSFSTPIGSSTRRLIATTGKKSRFLASQVLSAHPKGAAILTARKEHADTLAMESMERNPLMEKLGEEQKQRKQLMESMDEEQKRKDLLRKKLLQSMEKTTDAIQSAVRMHETSFSHRLRDTRRQIEAAEEDLDAVPDNDFFQVLGQHDLFGGDEDTDPDTERLGTRDKVYSPPAAATLVDDPTDSSTEGSKTSVVDSAGDNPSDYVVVTFSRGKKKGNSAIGIITIWSADENTASVTLEDGSSVQRTRSSSLMSTFEGDVADVPSFVRSLNPNFIRSLEENFDDSASLDHSDTFSTSDSSLNVEEE